jgi:hypothetical protein
MDLPNKKRREALTEVIANAVDHVNNIRSSDPHQDQLDSLAKALRLVIFYLEKTRDPTDEEIKAAADEYLGKSGKRA